MLPLQQRRWRRSRRTEKDVTRCHADHHLQVDAAYLQVQVHALSRIGVMSVQRTVCRLS